MPVRRALDFVLSSCLCLRLRLRLMPVAVAVYMYRYSRVVLRGRIALISSCVQCSVSVGRVCCCCVGLADERMFVNNRVLLRLTRRARRGTARRDLWSCAARRAVTFVRCASAALACPQLPALPLPCALPHTWLRERTKSARRCTASQSIVLCVCALNLARALLCLGSVVHK